MLIATLPPYVSHREQIAKHSGVDALRFNTIMPLAHSKYEILKQMKRICGNKPLWLDLKARQLRITEFSYLPYAYVKISRKIKLTVPAEVFLKDERAVVVAVVDGDRLILESRPHQVVGAGQPINILDPSLEISGYLTDDDKEYIEAAKSLGLHHYMLSFVEQPSDIEEVVRLDNKAILVPKIESQRGLSFVRSKQLPWGMQLMAARDDLYISFADNKIAMLAALKDIISADIRAIAASRILTSLEKQEVVSMGDISDLFLLHTLGYAHFMLSDELSYKPQTFMRAMDVFTQFINYISK